MRLRAPHKIIIGICILVALAIAALLLIIGTRPCTMSEAIQRVADASDLRHKFEVARAIAPRIDRAEVIKYYENAPVLTDSESILAVFLYDRGITELEDVVELIATGNPSTSAQRSIQSAARQAIDSSD